jgi:hypothetical protein
VVAATVLGSMLVHRLADAELGLVRPELAGAMLAVGLLASLFGGRTTFLVGAAFGIAALHEAVSRHVLSTTFLALLAALSSPVAGVFLATIGLAIVLSRALPRSFGLVLVLWTMGPIVVLTALFPEDGNFPFPLGGTVNLLLATALVAWLGRRYLFLRWLCAGYAAFVLLCFAVPNPVGGNVARLAALAVPVVVVMVATVAAQWVALLLVPLLVLQWAPISLTFTVDPAQTRPDFYRPLLDVLEARPGPLRVEVVPVATHFEADTVAREFPIARGWNRQHDRLDNSLFYGERLDPESYRAWLEDMGVTVVAIADTELDESGKSEAALLADPPGYLHEIHHDDVWTVFAVQPSPSLVDGSARMTSLGVDDFALETFDPGDTLVRVRFSPWFVVTHGDACIEKSPDGWTTVHVFEPGTVTVAAELRWSNLFDSDGNC